MDVSVIIVTYNSLEYVGACLQSVFNQGDGVEFEVIVVDNCSSDGTVRFVGEKFPSVQIVQNSVNVGFGAANNVGARVAKGRFLFFLNPDTELVGEVLGELMKWGEMDKMDKMDKGDKMEEMEEGEEMGGRVVGVGGRLVDADGRGLVSFGNFPSFFQLVADLGFRRLFPKYYREKLATGCKVDFEEPRLVDYVGGADLFILKEAFDSVGGFDEGFFMYYEEVDLAKRLSVVGCGLSVLPNVRILHREGLATAPTKGFNYQKYAMQEQSKQYYFKKHYGNWSVIWVKFLQLITLLLHTPFTNQKFTKSAKITLNQST